MISPSRSAIMFLSIHHQLTEAPPKPDFTMSLTSRTTNSPIWSWVIAGSFSCRAGQAFNCVFHRLLRVPQGGESFYCDFADPKFFCGRGIKRLFPNPARHVHDEATLKRLCADRGHHFTGEGCGVRTQSRFTGIETRKLTDQYLPKFPPSAFEFGLLHAAYSSQPFSRRYASTS